MVKYMVFTKMQGANGRIRFVHYANGRYSRDNKFGFLYYHGTLLTKRQVDEVLKKVQELGLQGEMFLCHC